MGLRDALENVAADLDRITNSRQDEQIKHLTKVVRVLWRKVERLERMIDADQHELRLGVGPASITLKQNGSIAIKGTDISIKGSGDVKVMGPKIVQN